MCIHWDIRCSMPSYGSCTLTDTLENLLREILVELRVQTEMLEQMQDEPDPSERATLDSETTARYETL